MNVRYHLLAPSIRPPVDKMNAAVKGDGPPKSTSSISSNVNVIKVVIILLAYKTNLVL